MEIPAILLYYALLTIYATVILWTIVLERRYDLTQYYTLLMTAIWLSILNKKLLVSVQLPVSIELNIVD
ncbi:MAG TPA: hypothetical protein EYH17_02095 [Pyrodictium sp.]|nr:hypothetical protein [Pyrodictium sp.]